MKIYDNDINKKISLSQLGVTGLQHVLVMYASAVMVPLILAAALNLTPKDLTYLISADLFTCGIATLLQTAGIGKSIGIRLPVMLGCTPIAVFPMIITGKTFGLTTVYGSIILSGLFVVLVAPLFQKISRLFPPVVTGTVISVIGLTLITIGASNIANGNETVSVLSSNLLLATITILIILIINKFGSRLLKAISVLISLIGTTIFAYYYSGIDLAIIHNSHWFNIVTPFYFGIPRFKISAIISMCFITLVIMIESTAVFYTLGEICEKKITTKHIVTGLRTEGLSQILGGIFNSFPYNTFAQNVGLVVLTQIKSRYVTIAAGIFLLALGLIPKFGALMTLIPKPVLGGAMLVLYGIVTTYGIRILSSVDFKNTNNVILIACSIGISLAIALKPELFAHLPIWMRIIFGNGVITGSFLAVLLNLFLNGISKEQEKLRTKEYT